MKNIKKYYSFITENKIVKNKNNYWTKERLQEEADKYLKGIEAAGFNDAFLIAKFKNEIISIQEALELLSN